MATYTTPLRTIIEQPTQHRNDLKFNERLEVGRVVLFDFDYPMFDDRYKKVFETNFINNFYDREIGFETEYLFKRRLQNWLRINMGYYSELLRSETLKFDPFVNSEMNVTHTKKNDETSKTDKNFGETTRTDITDTTTSDEDTTNSTQRDSTVDTSNKTDRDSIVDTTNTTDRDSTVNTQNDGTTNTEGQTSGKSSGTSKTTGNSKTDSTSNGTTQNDEFKRDLHTDTPDTRLAITTNDGEGTVGYASTIDESKSNSTQTTSNTGNETTQSTTDNTTSDTTSTTSTQNETTSETGLSKEQTDISEIGKSTEDTFIDELGKSIEDTDINEIGTRDEIIDRIVARLGKRDFDELTDGTTNTIEEFVQHRYGKIGVQTYSKMLMEYRQTFLRIEKEIFDEMNQLFMLVY